MTTLRHQIKIDAPVDAVWRVLGDLVAVQHYNPLVASAQFASSQHEGVGATRRCALKPKGTIEERVWDWQPPKALGLEVAKSDWPLVFMKWRTEIEAEGDATLVSQEMTYKVKFGLLGQLMDALMMRRMLDRSVGDIFVSLKRYVEDTKTV